jgi:type IX secretion system PorP/SprF family membrane protein
LRKLAGIFFCMVKGLGYYLFVILPFYGFSQQDPVYTQYMNNLLTVQPAYAGISGSLNITGISRAQWVGFEGAPNTNTLSVSGPVRNYNVGLGISIVNDKWGPIRQNGLYADYAYRVQLRRDQFLSFGIKGGFNVSQAYLTDLWINDPVDNVFAYDVKINFLPNIGLGILWHNDRFFLGASAPKILKNRMQAENGENVYHEVLHVYGMGGYVFYLSDIVKFKPTILYRWAERTPSYTEFSANILLYDRLWFGAAYRMKNSYGLIFQFNVNAQLKFGYAYDLTTFHPTQVNSGTHEFMISYDFVSIRTRHHTNTRYF